MSFFLSVLSSSIQNSLYNFLKTTHTAQMCGNINTLS